MNSLKFNINNGDTQVWEQKEADGEINIYRLLDDWEKKDEKPLCIPASDMVMIANLYREIKRIGIRDVFVNPYGNAVLSTGDSVTSALEKQIPKKPKGETDPMFGDSTTVCPSCGNANLVNPFVRSRVYDYCPNCGQALDWSDVE